MNKAKLISILLLFTVVPSRASAQYTSFPFPYYYFNQYQVTGGLISNSVFCTAQDKYGYLWIGTGNGICRYDGYHFTTVFDEEECKTMGGVTESIMVDSEGLVWFSTLSGKGWYDSATGMVTTIDLDTDSPVTSIVQDHAGNIWFCSRNLYRYDKDKAKVTTYPSGRYDFIFAASDSDGLVWCTCSDGRLLVYDSLVDKFKEEDISNLELIVPTSDKRMLASTAANEVVLFNPSDNTSEIIFRPESGITKVTSLLERVPGEFWIGTNEGIHIYFEETGRTLSATHSDSERMSLSSNEVKSLYADREGNVWVGTSLYGLNLWQNNENAFMFFYPIDREQSISGTVVRALYKSSNRIYAGTEDGGMNYLQMGDTYVHHIELHDKNNNYQDILEVGDELWICTYGNGIIRYNLKSSSIIRHYQFGSNQFHHLLQTSDGTILVSSTNGVFRYDDVSDTFILIPETEGSDVLDVMEDSAGKIWIGTYGKGIILMDKSLHITDNLQPTLRVTSLFEDSRHLMWVTTEGDAVFTIDVKSLETKHLSQEKGFPSAITCSVAEDTEGMIWIATSRGLHLLDPSTSKVVSSFFRTRETPSYRFTYGAACGSFSDTIFMGTAYGLLSFTPSKMKSMEMDKSIYISSIKGIVEDRLIDLCKDGSSASHTNKIVAS